MDISKLIEWAKQGKRTASVEYDNQIAGKLKIWVYDYELATGQFLDDANEIDTVDLKAKKIRDLQASNAELEELLGGNDNAKVRMA